jgi:hypothetical protein
MIQGNTLPLINEFLRVIGEQTLLVHLSGLSTPEQQDKVAVCTQVLLDEWALSPWTEKSVEGDRLIALYDAE